MKQGELVRRLEQALRVWEDSCFVARSIILHTKIHKLDFGLEGPIANSATFRDYLLKEKGKIFDFNRFIGGPEVQKYLGDIGDLPMGLFIWTNSSRRVFHLSSEIQTLFSATSLEGINWKDVTWPFDSFVLTLDDPISDKEGNLYDCILVSKVSECIPELKMSGSEIYQIYAFHTMLSNFKSYSFIDRENLVKYLKKEAWDKVSKFADNKYQGISPRGETRHGYINFTLAGDEPVSNFFSKEIELNPKLKEKSISGDPYVTDYSVGDKAAHLIVSLCLYLSTLSSQEIRPTKWMAVPRDKTFDQKAIAKRSQVFVITSKHKLTKQDEEVIAEIKKSRSSQLKCTHWRRGHWRKRPGEGINPDAPRIVHVRPCLINPGRLPEGSIPSGSKTLLK